MHLVINEKCYKKVPRLKNIDIEIPEGKMTVLIGTSGAGKSTIIKCITGITNFNGCVDVDPEDIAYIPQTPALNFNQTVFQSIYWTARLTLSPFTHSTQDIRQIVQQWMNTLGLSKFCETRIKYLSGGQKQRVSISKELVKGKKIIIADEIDTGLDCGVAYGLIERLGKITRENNKTTLIVSHNLSFLELYDNVVVLSKTSEGYGTVVYSGPPSDLLRFFEATNYVEILTKLNPVDEMGLGENEYFLNKAHNELSW